MIRDKKLIEAIDDYGRVVLDTEEVIDSMLSGHTVDGIFLKDKEDAEQYKSSCNEYAVDATEYKIYEELKVEPEEYFQKKSETWLIPKKYRNIDVVEYLSNKCSTEAEKERLVFELKEFLKRDQGIIINLMIYLVDVMRENNIVWGVGRGSSVACFVLYLIGINKVNPLEYDIDFREFFK